LEDLAAEELLDDLAAVAGGDHRVLVVTGRTAGGVGVRGRIRRAAAAHTTGTLTGAAGGLRRLAHQRGAAARGRRWRSGTGARRGGSWRSRRRRSASRGRRGGHGRGGPP